MGAIVHGNEAAVTPKFDPLGLTLVICAEACPELVKVTVCCAVVPTGTLPNETVAGLNANCAEEGGGAGLLLESMLVWPPQPAKKRTTGLRIAKIMLTRRVCAQTV